MYDGKGIVADNGDRVWGDKYEGKELAGDETNKEKNDKDEGKVVYPLSE